MQGMKGSERNNELKSLRAISRVSPEIKTNISDTSPVFAMKGDQAGNFASARTAQKTVFNSSSTVTSHKPENSFILL
jgi:hypothetical protein